MSHKRKKRMRRWLGFRAMSEGLIPAGSRAERRRALSAAIAMFTRSRKHRPRRRFLGGLVDLVRGKA